MAYTTINKSTDHFNTKLWTGNGSQPRAITGVGFQPDFCWLKDRDTAYHHQLYDSVRGTSAGVLYSSLTDGEDSSYALSSFDSDGFTLGSNLDAVNGNNKKIVSWNWKAGGSSSSNSDGNTTANISANTTAGFSIVSYTGTGSATTLGHGLGAVPKMIIFKNRDTTDEWIVYHVSTSATKFLRLNGTNATTDSATYQFNGTVPTSSIFHAGEGNSQSSEDYIAYCFAEKKGYSKFGSYTGNGNVNGPFCFTGFKPAFVIWKSISGESWGLVDNKRDSYNVTRGHLYPNLSNTEATPTAIMDFVSNGFKIRWSDTNINGSGTTYIYMAFGQSLVGSNNVPCTAR